MKKLTTIILFIMIAGYSSFGQSPLSKGKIQFNLGAGISGWGFPLYAGMDYGIHEDITIGVEGTFRTYSYHLYSHTITGITVNGNYHFSKILDIPEKFDFYAGINLGYFYWMSPADYTGTGSRPGIGTQVGGRYFLNKKLGLNLEFGGGNALSGGKFGITYIF